MKTLILSSGDEMYINSGSTDLLMYIPASTAAREKKITEIIKSNGLSSFIIDTISYKNHSIAEIKKIKNDKSYIVEVHLSAEGPAITKEKTFADLAKRYHELKEDQNESV